MGNENGKLSRLLPGKELDLARRCRIWRPVLMAFFLKRVYDPADADDLTQEVFTRLLSSNKPEATSSPGYVFQVAANLLRDRARREKVRTGYRDVVDTLYGQEIDWVDPEMVAIGRDTLARLVSGLDQLPERSRNIFILFRIENLESRAIAESFGISVSAVEKHVARALAHLIAWTQNDGKGPRLKGRPRTAPARPEAPRRELPASLAPTEPRAIRELIRLDAA